MKPILYFNHNRTFGIVLSLSRLFVATLGKFTEVKANARSHSVSKRKSRLKKVEPRKILLESDKSSTLRCLINGYTRLFTMHST